MLEFKKVLDSLKSKRGRHTELVTVMIPPGYELSKIMNQLAQEKGTASNIKSKKTRLNVMDALEKIMQRLALFKSTPETGLALFCGNVGNENDEWVLESIIPPEPLNTRVYRCAQTFFLEPLEEMLVPKDVYGLVVIDRGGASIGLLKGKNIQVLKTAKSLIPGKFRAGGQSAQRFERVREGMAKDYYKGIAEYVNKHLKDVKGIIVGGPGPTKEEFLHYLSSDVRKKVLAVKDVGYTDEYGLRELVEKSEDVLAEAEIMREKKAVQEFFRRIAKGEPVEYGKVPVMRALENGAVEKLLLSEDMLSEAEELMAMADANNAEVEFIGTETNEGQEFRAMGGIGALLRYA